MALAATVTKKWSDNQSVHAVGTIVASGSYTTGGEVVDFAPLMNTTKQPYLVQIEGIAGYKYEYNYSAKKMLTRQDAAAGNPSAEIAAASYPAGVTGDTITFYVVAPKFG